jgi:hypothetical protein
MTGQIKILIDRIVNERSKGNKTIAQTTQTKLRLKGIDPDRYLETSVDDPAVLARLKEIGSEMGVNV